jgi:chromosome segregation ATPase
MSVTEEYAALRARITSLTAKHAFWKEKRDAYETSKKAILTALEGMNIQVSSLEDAKSILEAELSKQLKALETAVDSAESQFSNLRS